MQGDRRIELNRKRTLAHTDEEWAVRQYKLTTVEFQNCFAVVVFGRIQCSEI